MARQEYTEAEVRSIMAAMQAEIDAATGLAAYRLEQMQADRKQALQWRDEVAAKPATDLLAQMKSLKDMLAANEPGTWTLIGPDGRVWAGEQHEIANVLFKNIDLDVLFKGNDLSKLFEG